MSATGRETTPVALTRRQAQTDDAVSAQDDDRIQNGRIGRSDTPDTKQHAHGLAYSALALLAWCLCSSAMIFVNKQVYSSGFHYPFAMTALGQLSGAVCGVLLVATGLFPHRPLSSVPALGIGVLPVAGATVVTLYTGNAAYLSLSVAFIQIMKGFTPCITLALAAALGKEKVSLELATSVVVTCAGTAVSVLSEGALPSFNMAGFVIMLVSCLTEALRAVLVQHLQCAAPGPCNLAETMIWISAPAAAMLALLSAAFEGGALAQVAQIRRADNGGLIVAAVFLSCFTNLTGFFAIQVTSSLTFKVVGIAKNMATIGISSVLGDQVTPAQMLGYFVSVGGTAYYTSVRSRSSARARTNGRRRE